MAFNDILFRSSLVALSWAIALGVTNPWGRSKKRLVATAVCFFYATAGLGVTIGT